MTTTAQGIGRSTGRSVGIDLGVASATWFRMPATLAEPHPSTTPAHSFGVSFTGHRRAVTQGPSGRRREIDVEPHAVFVTCDEPFDWVRVAEPYEGVEIVPDPGVMEEIADEYGLSLASGSDLVLTPDPVFWAVAVRLRQHALGVLPIGDVEGEELARALLTHAACEHHGGRPPRQNARPLDGARLSRVVEHVDAHLGARLSVSDLARVASMSTNHFHAAFRRATGLTPHEFVTARRVERATELLRAGRTREQAARTVGYTAGHAFRRALARFGT